MHPVLLILLTNILDSEHIEIVHQGFLSAKFEVSKGTDGRAFHHSLQYKTLAN